jgi:hypothetical protein
MTLLSNPLIERESQISELFATSQYSNHSPLRGDVEAYLALLRN